jgi:hypothetical protein
MVKFVHKLGLSQTKVKTYHVSSTYLVVKPFLSHSEGKRAREKDQDPNLVLIQNNVWSGRAQRFPNGYYSEINFYVLLGFEPKTEKKDA